MNMELVGFWSRVWTQIGESGAKITCLAIGIPILVIFLLVAVQLVIYFIWEVDFVSKMLQ